MTERAARRWSTVTRDRRERCGLHALSPLLLLLLPAGLLVRITCTLALFCETGQDRQTGARGGKQTRWPGSDLIWLVILGGKGGGGLLVCLCVGFQKEGAGVVEFVWGRARTGNVWYIRRSI